MRVKCVICEKINVLENDSIIAKRLRNHPIHTYMCPECDKRIAEKTASRIATGKFRWNIPTKQEDDW